MDGEANPWIAAAAADAHHTNTQTKMSEIHQRMRRDGVDATKFFVEF